MAMPQQQQQQQQPNGQAVGYFHVPQPQNMQMVTIPNQAVNNMKPGAVLGNNGIQAVPETAYMNPMVVTQAQIAQPTMAYTTEAPVNKWQLEEGSGPLQATIIPQQESNKENKATNKTIQTLTQKQRKKGYNTKECSDPTYFNQQDPILKPITTDEAKEIRNELDREKTKIYKEHARKEKKMEILSYTQGYDELSDMTDYAELDFEGYEELKRRDEEAAKPPFSGSFSIKSRPATRVSCGMARIATMKVSVKKTKPQHGNHMHGSIHNKASMYMSEEEEENYDEMSEFCDWTLGEDMDWEEEQPLGIQTAHAPSLRYSIRTRGTNNNDNSQHQWIPESEDDDSFSDDGLVRMAERIEREKQENRSKKNKKIQFQNRGGESENEQEGDWPFDSVSWTQELEDMNQQQQPTGTRDHQNQNHQGYYGPPDIEEMELDGEDNQSQI